LNTGFLPVAQHLAASIAFYVAAWMDDHVDTESGTENKEA
jgi:hypothetical protein